MCADRGEVIDGSVNTSSVMPAYGWLIEKDLRFDEIQARVDSMAMLGVPYGPLVEEGAAVEHAREQARTIASELKTQAQGYPIPEDIENKRIIALIAYMQRLGTDLYKDPPSENPNPSPSSEGQTQEEASDASE